MAKSEKRVAFKMHPRLLYDVVTRQAGTRSKAVLEGVMNMIDAKATTGEVEIAEERITLRDNGQGFRNAEEIENWFAVLGQPHDESEEKIFGQFRMGRGQLFAFGKNRWRSGNFEMLVDFRNCPQDDSGFTLVEHAKRHVGCEIEIQLYEPLVPSQVAEIEREISNYCKYAPIDLFVNGKQINKDPAEEKWSEVTDEAYLRFNASQSLEIYNLGVFVHTKSKWQMGIGGEVVSRKQLRVNFARNDVQHDCPVWKKIRPKIAEASGRSLKKAKSLDDQERQRLVDQLIAGEMPWSELSTKNLLTNCIGRHMPLNYMFINPSAFNATLSVAPKGSLLGDKLIHQKVALVLADTTLQRFRVETLEEFAELYVMLKNRGDSYGQARLFYELVDFETLSKGYQTDHIILEERQLKPTEKLWLKVMQDTQQYLRVSNDSGASRRTILIGDSETALGWTDGSRYIAMSRQFLAELNFDVRGFTSVGHVLLHEKYHGDSSASTHLHTEDFYQAYHDASETLGVFVDACLGRLPAIAKTFKRQLSKKAMKSQDQLTLAERAFNDLKPLMAASE